MATETGITEHYIDSKRTGSSRDASKQLYTEEVSPVEGAASGSGSPVEEPERTVEDIREERSKGWFAYLKTRDFYILLLLG